jgi:hypothetical protein
MQRVDDKERAVVDAAAVEARLLGDPRALDALVTGAQGLPDAVSAALAEADAAASPPAAAPAAVASPVSVDRRLAEALRTARATDDLGKLQLLQALPTAVTRGVDLLV